MKALMLEDHPEKVFVTSMVAEGDFKIILIFMTKKENLVQSVERI